LNAFLKLIARVAGKKENMNSFIAQFTSPEEQANFHSVHSSCMKALSELLNGGADITGNDAKVAEECMSCLSKIATNIDPN